MKNNISSPSSVIAIDLFASSLGAVILLFLITVPFMNLDVSAANLIKELKSKSERVEQQLADISMEAKDAQAKAAARENEALAKVSAVEKKAQDKVTALEKEVQDKVTALEKKVQAKVTALEKENGQLDAELESATEALDKINTGLSSIAESLSEEILADFMARLNLADASSFTGVYEATQKCQKIHRLIYVIGDRFGNVSMYIKSNAEKDGEDLNQHQLREGYLLADNRVLTAHKNTFVQNGGWVTLPDSNEVYDTSTGVYQTSFTCQSARRKGAYEELIHTKLSDTVPNEIIQLMEIN